MQSELMCTLNLSNINDKTCGAWTDSENIIVQVYTRNQNFGWQLIKEETRLMCASLGLFGYTKIRMMS